MSEKNILSLQLNADDFIKADSEEKESLVVMRESVGFFRDGIRRFAKNKIAMASLVMVLIIMIFCFIVPIFYPYKYEQQIKGSERLAPMQYSATELKAMEGEIGRAHV